MIDDARKRLNDVVHVSRQVMAAQHVLREWLIYRSRCALWPINPGGAMFALREVAVSRMRKPAWSDMGPRQQ